MRRILKSVLLSAEAHTALISAADIPAVLCKGALEALGGQLDFERDILTIRRHGVDIPLSVNGMGHYALSAVAFGTGPSCGDRRPNLAASNFEWALLEKRPDLSAGGLHLSVGSATWRSGCFVSFPPGIYRPVRQLLWEMRVAMTYQFPGRLL